MWECLVQNILQSRFASIYNTQKIYTFSSYSFSGLNKFSSARTKLAPLLISAEDPGHSILELSKIILALGAPSCILFKCRFPVLSNTGDVLEDWRGGNIPKTWPFIFPESRHTCKLPTSCQLSEIIRWKHDNKEMKSWGSCLDNIFQYSIIIHQF